MPSVSVSPVFKLPPAAVVAIFRELTEAIAAVVAPLPTMALLVGPAEAKGT